MEVGPGGLRERKKLRGRVGESAMLDELVQDVRDGESRSLLLRGEPGIGKTALLEYMIGAAPDLTILRALGVESDMELAFASLHQLCGPILDRLGPLPDPQRQALEVVFGARGGFLNGDPPPAGLSDEQRDAYEQLSTFYANHVAYALIMATRPQTLYWAVRFTGRPGGVHDRPRRRFWPAGPGGTRC
jgi:hypothetical protein